MYDELIVRLRGVEEMLKVAQFEEAANLIEQAADAIEELSIVVEGYRKRMWTGNSWIPVNEQLPEDFKKVLVFWQEHSEPMIDTAFWREDSKSFNCSHWERAGEKVTHWMPLPEPPKEE